VGEGVEEEEGAEEEGKREVPEPTRFTRALKV